MASTELSKKFTIGDTVVYPLRGVGKIADIEMRGEREYLRIYLSDSDMDILLPTENAEKLGLRHLATKEEAEDAIASLKQSLKYNAHTDWKERLQENQDLIKEGSLLSVASVVNTLYRRSKIKELPALEKRLYDSALIMLVDETSSVLGLSLEEMRRQIFSVLEPQCSEFQLLH